MKNLKVTKFKYKRSNKQESTFIVLLNIGKKMEIPIWSFFEFVNNRDLNLAKYSERFDEWEELTEDLISMGYNFEEKLTEYVIQFTEEEINEFSFS
jgi:hypothetical protein